MVWISEVTATLRKMRLCVNSEKLNHLPLNNLGVGGLGILIDIPFSGFTSK